MARPRRKAAGQDDGADFSYDQAELVGCVRRHYELLARMGHLSGPALAATTPPPTGWSDAQLNVTALRALGRTERVIELLRHLPYPRSGDGDGDGDGADDDDADATVYYETKVQPYLRDRWRPEDDDDDDDTAWNARPLCDLGLAPFDGPMAAHLVALTREDSELGTIWLIDTERGCLYPHGTDYLLDEDEVGPDADEKPWLRARAVPFRDYFDRIHREISSLKLVPVPAAGNLGPAICMLGDPEAKAIKKLYGEYGWPSAFRKEEFVQAATAARAAILADKHDWTDEE